MKLLWLCNMTPGSVMEAMTGTPSAGGLWVDHVLEQLRRREELEIRILCPGAGIRGAVDDRCGYATFREGLPYRYLTELEAFFREELKAFQPDVVHIWGTEYGHTLAMVNACEQEGLLDHMAVSIQGLCGVYAGHYAEGLPRRVSEGWTFRDVLRWDNVAMQRKKFALRGELETQALKKARNVIGRTDWDRACTRRINPDARYHFCNETLRETFYQGQWRYDACRKHRIFASSCAYPVKGFHYLLEAFAQVRQHYPDATLAVTGKDIRQIPSWRQGSYQKYLLRRMRELKVGDSVEFLGGLSAEEMKNAYLEANVFALPSTIENSPNSLGEAMLLGVPCVAADVGGVSNMLVNRQEGFVYPSTAAYMLSDCIQSVFAMGTQAEAMGAEARRHGAVTHDSEKNLRDLLEIYSRIRK